MGKMYNLWFSMFKSIRGIKACWDVRLGKRARMQGRELWPKKLILFLYQHMLIFSKHLIPLIEQPWWYACFRLFYDHPCSQDCIYYRWSPLNSLRYSQKTAFILLVYRSLFFFSVNTLNHYTHKEIVTVCVPICLTVIHWVIILLNYITHVWLSCN